MSDEYRHVLHEWARTLLPADIGDVEIVDVELSTSEGGRWECTVEDPSFNVYVHYRDCGAVQCHLAATDFEDGGIVMSRLLHQLFAIAAREESNA